jgi:hypothetical protein
MHQHHPRPLRRPTSHAGRWAIRLAGAAFLLLAVAQAVVVARQTSAGEDAIGHLAQVAGPAIGIALGLSGLGALVASSIALFRNHDRRIAVWLAFAYGVVVVLLFVGEIAVPH